MRWAMLVALVQGILLEAASAQETLPRSRGVGEPVAVLADGRPIELPYRGLFPFVGDLDGDGRRELLLGTPDAGRLKVFPNLGSNQPGQGTIGCCLPAAAAVNDAFANWRNADRSEAITPPPPL